MGEPFTALDAATRVEIQRFLVEVWEATRKTVAYATDDVAEAVCLADRVVVLSASPGRMMAGVTIPLPRLRDPLGPECPAWQRAVRSHLANGTEG